MKKESPEYIKLSLASAITLGFKQGLFYRGAKNYCINLLLNYDEGCVANCAYCGLSKMRSGTFLNKSFIRVDWPLVETERVVEKINENKQKIRRICVSMITNKRARGDSQKIVKMLKNSLKDMPVSVLLSPTIIDKEDLIEYKKNGVDRVGIAIDCATYEIFEKLRGKGVKGPHKWEKYWQIFNDSLEVFGSGKVGIHLIVGLGETEEEMIKLIYKIVNSNGKIHLFSFYPESNSKLSTHSQPSIIAYRKIQLSVYLLDEVKPLGFYGLDNFVFNERGNLVKFNIPRVELEKIIFSGTPFMTSGCPAQNGEIACNRPFANESPREEIRNFPFLPEKLDLEKIAEQLKSFYGTK